MQHVIAHGSRFAKLMSDPSQVCEWSEAFTEKHNYDAHAWSYLAYDESGELLDPQVRVPVKDFPGTVLCGFVFLDYDDPDHDETLRLFGQIPEGHYLQRPCSIYFTRGGMRFVYRLTDEVMAGDYAALVRGMALELWRITTLRVDPSTDQWHRCFRLPFVVRNDEKAKGPTWGESYFREPYLDTDALLDPADVTPRQEQLPWAKKSSIKAVQEDMPEPAEIHPLRLRMYKQVLRLSRFRHYLFEQVPIPEGRRDQTLLAMAGEVVAKAFSAVPEASPEEVFQLLLPAVEQLEPDGSETWPAKSWRLIGHAWSQEAAKQEEREKKLEVESTQRDRIVEEMLKHVPADEVPNDPVQRAAFAARHFCLQTGSMAFVVQKDGTYSPNALKTSQLPAHFNDGLQCLTPSGFYTAIGTPLSGEAILASYSVNLDAVEYLASEKRSCQMVRVGDKRVLQVSPFSLRSDLVDAAELDADIDGWLDSFPDPALLRRWIAAALALHMGGIAALYLHGPARVGKSMLAQGLAECFHAQPVPGAQAFSEFNGGLYESPVIMVDEGLPTRITGTDTADLFRSLVTGGPISVMKKHRDATVSKIPYRMIFAANSFDMVRQLVGKRTMAPQDREALRERILVIDTTSRPADYLDRRGAMSFTRDSKKGSWLGGAHRLARHFIRLYQLQFQEQEFVRDGRLLVEGLPHPSFTMQFDLSGMGHEVVDDLCQDISKIFTRKNQSSEVGRTMTILDGRVWIKKRPYARVACTRTQNRGGEGYLTALDRFLTGKTRQGADESLEHEVDLNKLSYCAEADGHVIVPLRKLLSEALGVT